MISRKKMQRYLFCFLWCSNLQFQRQEVQLRRSSNNNKVPVPVKVLSATSNLALSTFLFLGGFSLYNYINVRRVYLEKILFGAVLFEMAWSSELLIADLDCRTRGKCQCQFLAFVLYLWVLIVYGFVKEFQKHGLRPTMTLHIYII